MAPPWRPDSSQKCSSRSSCAWRIGIVAGLSTSRNRRSAASATSLSVGSTRIGVPARKGAAPISVDEFGHHGGIDLEDDGDVRPGEIGLGDLADRGHVCGDQQRLAGMEIEGAGAHGHVLAALQHQGHERPVDRILDRGRHRLPHHGKPGDGVTATPCASAWASAKRAAEASSVSVMASR